MTPSNLLDENGEKIPKGELESESVNPEEESEAEAEEEAEEEADGEDQSEEDEDPDLTEGDKIHRNITSFHRQQMKCIDRHFFKKPGEQLPWDSMMEDCNGEDNIHIEKFYNDIEWQIRDLLRHSIRDKLREGYCDEIFMQCFAYMRNIEIFMSMDYDIKKSMSANKKILLREVDTSNYMLIRDMLVEFVDEYADLKEVLEEKKEFMAKYFENKQIQYRAEYGKDEEEEEEHEEEHDESEEEDEEGLTEEEREEAEVMLKEQNDKEQALEEQQKIEDQRNDTKNVYNDKEEDPDAPFEQNEEEPALEDAVPGYEKTPTEYGDRKQGNANIEVTDEEKEKANEDMEPEEIIRLKRIENTEKAHRKPYDEIMEIRNELDEMDRNPDYDETKFFDTKKTVEIGERSEDNEFEDEENNARKLKTHLQKKKKRRKVNVQRRVQQMFQKDMLRVNSKIQRDVAREKRKARRKVANRYFK